MRIEGWCDRRFGAVETAFRENFSQRGERGAAVCLVTDGTIVADLWGGYRDAEGTLPWQRDTLVNIYSIGKGIAALCMARLAGQGLIDPDAAVVRYWPEFGAGDKDRVTVRQLLSHQAGLPSVRRRLPPNAMFDHALMAGALAAQEPWWEPGTAHGYHTNTFGFLVGELVRRVTGRTLGTVLREEIAGPLGADLHIGLPESQDDRVAEFIWPAMPDGAVVEFVARANPDRAGAPAGLTEDQLMEYNAYSNPPGLSGAGVVNTRAWRAAEIPSTNGHGTARGVARVYEALAAGGHTDGVVVVDPAALAAATEEQVYGEDRILHRPSRFALGFQLTQPERPLGPNPRAFGHFGAGGSLGFCDPDAGVAFGYVMNEMGPRWQNPRNRALLDAIYASVGAGARLADPENA